MFPAESQPVSLKGQLLLADPSLRESTFRRSVILIAEHGEEEGALGYILNRPVGKSVGDLLVDPQLGGLAGLPVYLGGPVNTEQLTFGCLGWAEAEAALQYSTHLSAPQALRYQEEGFSVRAFVGYSGWSEGQLESELERNAWIVLPPQKRVVEAGAMESLWQRMLREISPWHALMADEPDDCSLN